MIKNARIFTSIVLLLLLLLLGSELYAQCPMCRIAAESNLKGGGSAGRGLNAGILYMLATPYLLVLIGGYIWYKKFRKRNLEEVSRNQ